MIHTLRGTVQNIYEHFLVLDVHGVGFKILSNAGTIARASQGKEVTLFCFLYVREDKLDLYGFLEEESLRLFELLNGVAGIGPKTALGMLDIDTVPNVMAAILERKVELLSRAPGIGKKTAERVVIELQNKIKLTNAKTLTEKMGVDVEVEEALVGLGYLRHDVKKTLQTMESGGKTVEDRLRSALKHLGRTK